MNELVTLPDPAEFNLMAPLARREAILRLEAYALERSAQEGEFASVKQCAVLHHWAPGAYGREFMAPAGALCIGKIHRHAHLNIVSQGECLVYTEGEGAQRITAPHTFVSSPGSKRVVLPLSELCWTTVHVTDKTTLLEIEEEMIATCYEKLPFEPVGSAQ